MSHGCPCQLDNQKFFGVQETMLDVYGHDKMPIKCDRECSRNIIRGTGTSVNPINVPYTVQQRKSGVTEYDTTNYLLQTD